MSEPTREQLATQVRYLEAEVTDLRRRLDDVPGQARGLESRLADAQRSLAAVSSQNERLAQTLRDARDLFASSSLAREAFGAEVVEHYLNNARVELDAFESAVTDWERVRGFERL